MQRPSGDRTTDKLLRQQASLAAFGMFAFREDSLPKILTEAARICAESLGVPFSKVCRYRAEENDLLIEAGVGWHDGVIGQVVSRADATSPQGRAYTTRTPVLIRDVNALNDIRLPPFYHEHHIVSTIDVVIQGLAGPPYGVMEIDSPVERDYDQHDIDFLTGFTNVLAEAVATAARTEVLRHALAAKDELIAEKNMLAQELQHRVRNNLHIVHAMLNSELRQHPENEGIAAIARRVMTMSRVYDHLLGVGMTRTIDFGAYITSLSQSLLESQPDANAGISITCEAGGLALDLDTVTTLGMAVAELVANSFRHAFPLHHGHITVALRHIQGAPRAELTVSDDGIGLPTRLAGKRYGLGLVNRLMEQVGGAMTARPGPGTSWLLTFPVTTQPAATADSRA